MSLYPELDGLSREVLVARFEGAPLDGPESAVAYFSEVAVRLATAGGADDLWTRRDGSDVAHARAVILALSRHDAGRPGLAAWLRTRLGGDSDVAAEAIDALARLDDETTAEAILALATHPSEYVRGAVLRYATRRTPARAFALLEAAAHDPHFIVRENVADELAMLRDPRARPLLERLAADEHPHVRQAAASALAELADG